MCIKNLHTALLLLKGITIMQEQDIKQLTANFGEMERLLKSYTEATDVIMQTESENSEKIAEKIAEREVIIGEIDFLKKQCSKLIDSGEQSEAKMIREFLTGVNTNQHVTDSFITLRSAIVGLRSAQSQAAEKDEALKKQFNSRSEEAKSELVKLNDEKKKLDYYSSVNTAPANLGGSLDSSF